jgi:hypothetical protein
VPDGAGDFLLRSLTKVTSDYKAQGSVTTPSQFQTGPDAGAGNIPDYALTQVTGALLSGLKVIAIDDNTGLSAWSRYTSAADILDLLTPGGSLSLSAKDIIYFGAETGVTPLANFYNDTTVTNGQLSTGGVFSADGKTYTKGLNDFGAGAGSTLLLTATFQDLGGSEVDSQGRAAPAGTLLSQFLSDGSVRPFAMLDVVPGSGTEAGAIKDQGMTFTLATDTNADMFVDTGTKTFTGDIALSLGSTVPAANGFSTFSDPAEFVSTPEPVSLIAWSGLICAVGVGVFARRLKQS